MEKNFIYKTGTTFYSRKNELDIICKESNKRNARYERKTIKTWYPDWYIERAKKKVAKKLLKRIELENKKAIKKTELNNKLNSN